MVFELLLTNKLIFQELNKDNNCATMNYLPILLEREEKVKEVRAEFAKYIEFYNLDREQIKSKLELLDKL